MTTRKLAIRTAAAILLFLAALSRASPVSASPAADLEKYLSGLATWSADFEQTIDDGHGNVLRSAAGRLYLQRPGKFRWDYSQPSEQLVLADGKQIWFYDKDLAQANVRDMDTSLASTPASLLSGSRLGEHSVQCHRRAGERGTAMVSACPQARGYGFSTRADRLRQGRIALHVPRRQAQSDHAADLFKFEAQSSVGAGSILVRAAAGGRRDRARRQVTVGDGTYRPLADRLRPQSLDEYVGQSHLLGAGAPLRRALESGRPHSMILWGPPGTGKTTLARLVANGAHAEFIAPLGGAGRHQGYPRGRGAGAQLARHARYGAVPR